MGGDEGEASQLGAGWVAGSRVKDEGRGSGGYGRVREEDEGRVGSLGQGSVGRMFLESDSIESSGERVTSFSFFSVLLLMSRRKCSLVLICL